jgi:hypothetical protein
MVKVANALKPPATHRAIVINEAAVIVAEELATAIDVGQDFFNARYSIVMDADVNRIRPEPRVFRFIQKHRELMPILPAAVRAAALAAGAFSEDGQTEITHCSRITPSNVCAALHVQVTLLPSF